MRKWNVLVTTLTFTGLVLGFGAGIARAQDDDENPNDSRAACQGLPSQGDLKSALIAARGLNSAQSNGGFGLHMWATIVNRDGVVCAVAYTGNVRSDQWPGSRVISAQKANTANAFSLPSLVLSTANLYSAVQPGGSLAGLQESNPVNTEVAYRGNPKHNGEGNDGMIGGRIGGINIFGGGLALYKSGQNLIGGLGVSGDSSCADHNIAWRVRNILELDYLPNGVSGDANRPDNIVYDIATLAGHSTGVSAGGWGHPACSAAATAIAPTLPAKR
ncbi:MAG TPA: heme-binding protein [Bryobacteraceae bacterium]|nr:heme-binding protein [Bryobacteraceae bacterium]